MEENSEKRNPICKGSIYGFYFFVIALLILSIVNLITNGTTGMESIIFSIGMIIQLSISYRNLKKNRDRKVNFLAKNKNRTFLCPGFQYGFYFFLGALWFLGIYNLITGGDRAVIFMILSFGIAIHLTFFNKEFAKGEKKDLK